MTDGDFPVDRDAPIGHAPLVPTERFERTRRCARRIADRALHPRSDTESIITALLGFLMLAVTPLLATGPAFIFSLAGATVLFRSAPSERSALRAAQRRSGLSVGDRVAVTRWFEYGSVGDDPGTLMRFTKDPSTPYFVHFDNGSRLSVHSVEPLVADEALAARHTRV